MDRDAEPGPAPTTDRPGPATLFADALPAARVLTGPAVGEEYASDETLSAHPRRPQAVVLPESTEEVAAVLAAADRHRVPVTARGAGSGLSGAAIPDHDGVVLSFERMSAILELDPENGVAVVEPGVRLHQLDDALAPHGLFYPVRPGEESATVGGTVATNAAGMRAVRYGVTRNHVLGLELVLASGEVLRTGGKFVKVSSGYDLTQLVIGSEGTLALVTRVWLKLSRRPANTSTVLAPFHDLREVTAAIPPILAAGLDPLILEYVDLLTMAGMVSRAGIDLGVPDEIRERALAYLVVQLDGEHPERVEQDTVTLGGLLTSRAGGDGRLRPAGGDGGEAHHRPRAGLLLGQGGGLPRPHRRRGAPRRAARLRGAGGRDRP
jgi:glycolate oxidase